MKFVRKWSFKTPAMTVSVEECETPNSVALSITDQGGASMTAILTREQYEALGSLSTYSGYTADYIRWSGNNDS